MNDLEGEPLKVGMTTFSLMAQIARGGGELVRGKYAMWRNIQTAFVCTHKTVRQHKLEHAYL